jgi:SAM-dependent methyltransferase
MKVPAIKSKCPDYGIDGPIVLRNLALIGSGAIALGLAAYHELLPMSRDIAFIFVYASAGVVIFNLICITLSIWSSKVGKIREAEKLLSTYDWQGDEKLLDVGCGRGLIMIAAAKRLSAGTAVGVDIWDSRDQTGNRSANTLENARIEDVADRVQIANGDARQLPFLDNTFDMIVSSKALHNIIHRQEREGAVHEISRVLKPGGKLAIIDSLQYAKVLQQIDWKDIKASGLRFHMFPPVRWTIGIKPASN